MQSAECRSQNKDNPISTSVSCHLSSVTLTFFRNYDHLTLAIPPQPIVLTGPNGVGKTNLLEALSLLSPGKGLRKAQLHELRNHQSYQQSCGFSIELCKGKQTHQIGIAAQFDRDTPKKAIRIDGQDVAKQTALSDILSVAWFTPEMARLFAMGKGERRQFFDRLVYALDPCHAHTLTAYDQVMKQRMRQLQTDPQNTTLLSAYEQTMADYGYRLMQARFAYLEAIKPFLSMVDGFPSMSLDLEGNIEKVYAQKIEQTKQIFAGKLEKNRKRDQAMGMTYDGPHRCDWTAFHQDKAMPALYCSTGEQKAMVMSLLLAHVTMIEQRHGHSPLFLIDEGIAHLDENRRHALLNHVGNLQGQTWLSGTDINLFAPLQSKAFFFQLPFEY